MDNKFIQKSLDNTSSKLQKSLRFPDMTEEKFWLMNYDPVVIAWDLKNHIKSVHTSSTLFIDKNPINKSLRS